MHNKALHLTAFSLRYKAAGELDRLRIIFTSHSPRLIAWVWTSHLSRDHGGPGPRQDVAVGAFLLTHPWILWYAQSIETGAADDM